MKTKKTYVWQEAIDLGYTPITDLWQRFSETEDAEGAKGVRKLYRTAFEECLYDYKKLTELVMVLNHKIFAHRKDDALARTYDALWRKADGYACDTLKGDEESYYYRTTD